VGAARRRSRGHGPARLDGARPRATVADKVMESGKTAGHGNGLPTRRPHGKRSAQARSWKPGRRRQPSGARERWKPDRGETPQAARCATRTTARPAISQVAGDAQPSKPKKQQNQGEHTQGIVDLLQMRSGRSGVAGSAVFKGRQACAAGIARRAFPWRQAQRAAPQARRHRHRAQQKERCAAPEGTTHRRQRGAISSPPAPSSTATVRSRQAQRTRKPARPRSAC